MKRLLIILAALVAAVGLAGFRPDAAQAQDTAAVAVNTKDGSSIFKLAFAIKRAAGDVVDNANAAVAISSCNECRTVAISIQIVLVTGDPDVVTPQNLALAYNIECTSCETFASAYQYVLDPDGNVHFTPEGRQEVQDIRKELRELAGAGLPLAELDARLNELMQRVAVVLRNELVASGKSADASSRDDEGGTEERAPPTTATAPAETEPAPTTATAPTETEPTPTTSTPTETTPTTEPGETTTTP